jgi:hypothetical protein
VVHFVSDSGLRRDGSHSSGIRFVAGNLIRFHGGFYSSKVMAKLQNYPVFSCGYGCALESTILVSVWFEFNQQTKFQSHWPRYELKTGSLGQDNKPTIISRAPGFSSQFENAIAGHQMFATQHPQLRLLHNPFASR